MTEQAAATATDGGQRKPQFAIQRLYVKDVSFEVPSAPAVFMQEWAPEIKVEFSSAAGKLSESQYEVVLLLTVKAMLKDKVAYIAETRYAGVFVIDGFDAATTEMIIGAQCPTVLYPYGREVIHDLITRGSFPQFNLQPINFEAVYLDARRRRQEADSAEAAKH